MKNKASVYQVGHCLRTSHKNLVIHSNLFLMFHCDFYDASTEKSLNEQASSSTTPWQRTYSISNSNSVAKYWGRVGGGGRCFRETLQRIKVSWDFFVLLPLLLYFHFLPTSSFILLLIWTKTFSQSLTKASNDGN